jgi:hypothetical protein
MVTLGSVGHWTVCECGEAGQAEGPSFLLRGQIQVLDRGYFYRGGQTGVGNSYFAWPLLRLAAS